MQILQNNTVHTVTVTMQTQCYNVTVTMQIYSQSTLLMHSGVLIRHASAKRRDL